MAMLDVHDIHTYYGNIHALKGVSLTVEEGEIVTMIGANGAGKSTTLNTICGLLQPHSGSIVLEGQEIHAVPAHDIVGMGVSQVPEGRRVFARLTVLENLEMGAFLRQDPDGIRRDMVRQVTGSVQWLSCIQWLMDNGVSEYVECGPGRVLSGLIKRIDREAKTHTIQDVETLGKVVGQS